MLLFLEPKQKLRFFHKPGDPADTADVASVELTCNGSGDDEDVSKADASVDTTDIASVELNGNGSGDDEDVSKADAPVIKRGITVLPVPSEEQLSGT